MTPEPSVRGSRLAAAVLGGALLLVLGTGLAARYLPPWSTRVPPPDEAGRWLTDFARRLGAEETAGPPRLELAARRLVIDQALASVAMPPDGVREDVLVRTRTEVRWATGETRQLMAVFTPAGVPRLARFRAPAGQPYRRAGFTAGGPTPAEVQAAVRAFLRPGETLSPLAPAPFWHPYLAWQVAGSRPAERVFAYAEGRYAFVLRVPEPSAARIQGFSARLWRLGLIVWGLLILGLGVVAALLLRRRIALDTGVQLAAAGLLTSLPAWWDPVLNPIFLWIGTAFAALASGFVWALGESLLRPVEPALLVGLDALTARRLGPQGGRALLWGLAGGLGLAGLDLAINGVAFASRGFALRCPWLSLPSFAEFNFLTQGALHAGWILLSLALARRFLPRRATFAVALALSSLYLEPWGPSPWWMEAGLNLALGAGFLLLAQRAGIAALLAATLTYQLAFLATFAALHPVWLATDFSLATAGLLACLGLGIAGLFQPAQDELRRLRPPAFIRRLEEERRLEGEVALLSRAQRTLLPQTPPEIAGWELAVASADGAAIGSFHDFLPDGESRQWLAVGDVTGQGLACAMVQAMTKAALSALVGRGGGPAAILAATHRILERRSGLTRGTTLALLCFDTATGEGRIANAGHPPPLWLAADSSVAPLELAGPPLGDGPVPDFEERALHWEPGSALLFGSAALWEARDAAGWPFSPAQAAAALAHLHDEGGTAHDIARGLLAAWREPGEGEERRDDASVVVVRRLSQSGA